MIRDSAQSRRELETLINLATAAVSDAVAACATLGLSVHRAALQLGDVITDLNVLLREVKETDPERTPVVPPPRSYTPTPTIPATLPLPQFDDEPPTLPQTKRPQP